MPKISSITCHKVVNSRGDWTIGTKVTLDDGSTGVQTIPEGASKGENEAYTIPADKAAHIINTALNDLLVGEDAFNQKVVDERMLEMDGTPNKSHVGGNSILSVSLALAQAAASSKKQELYQYLAELYGTKIDASNPKFPTPLFNILNGGKHAHNALSFQEFMVVPSPTLDYRKSLDIGITCYHLLKDKLIQDGFETDVGDEGGFAPNGFTAKKALTYIKTAASQKFTPGKDVFFGMDVASGSFRKEDEYEIPEENLILTWEKLEKYYLKLANDFELIYLEDPFYEKDYAAWHTFTGDVHKRFYVSGDDLFVTNPRLLKKGIEMQLATAVIVKPNQIGTLTETMEFIKMAQIADMAVIVSHRSGDTAEDTFISDLALAVGADFIKAGAPARGERVAKYNRLLEIYSNIKK